MSDYNIVQQHKGTEPGMNCLMGTAKNNTLSVYQIYHLQKQPHKWGNIMPLPLTLGPEFQLSAMYIDPSAYTHLSHIVSPNRYVFNWIMRSIE